MYIVSLVVCVTFAMSAVSVSLISTWSIFSLFNVCVLLSCRRAFELAYEMLQSSPKTGCQQFVIWVTDEQHADNDVRCEPGHYVQTDDGSEYVPGRLCDFVSTYERVLSTVQSNTRISNV